MEHAEEHVEHAEEHVEHVEKHVEHTKKHMEHVEKHVEHAEKHVEHAEEHMEHAEGHVEHAEKHVEHAAAVKQPLKRSSQAEQQHNLNRAGTSLLMAVKKQGTPCCFCQCRLGERCPKKCKELPFPCFPTLNQGWRTAKSGSEHVVDPMIRS